MHLNVDMLGRSMCIGRHHLHPCYTIFRNFSSPCVVLQNYLPIGLITGVQSLVILLMHGMDTGSFAEGSLMHCLLDTFYFVSIVSPSLRDSLCFLAGTSGRPAFHVVVPSLPGYGFSSAPTQPGFGVKKTADTFAQLMLSLGYPNYVAQGSLASGSALYGPVIWNLPAGKSLRVSIYLTLVAPCDLWQPPSSPHT